MRTWRTELRQFCLGGMVAGLLIANAAAQTPLTWQQVKEQFEAANPTLLAGQLGIQESKAQEITAYLKPNPSMTAGLDQINPFAGYTGAGGESVYRPFSEAFPSLSFSYLYERDGKRELRRDSARKGTAIAESQLADTERNLLFNLRNAFIQTLQAKAVLAMAQDNLDYFNHEISISRDRFSAGDIARVDLNRLELQRVQYEQDYQTAKVNLETAKITLRMLLNTNTPLDKFDVTGPFDFAEKIILLEELHTAALDARPDLRAAVQSIEKARTDHRLAVANGSTDPTFGMDLARNPPIPVYVGFNVNIDLRIHDRNQGEKARTEIDIRRAERSRDAAQAQVFSDVDSAYVTMISTVNLLKQFKGTDGYLERATSVRDITSFSYQHGQASLLDYLDSQRDYRTIQVNYLNLVGSYLTAANQLNMAVGQEVIQ
jgi:cobalt-zinc-cadmium efflux system outer membrane protein